MLLTFLGALDPADYRQPIMTLLFIKLLNDTFEENAEKLVKECKSQIGMMIDEDPSY